jgi:hypothetical protein
LTTNWKQLAWNGIRFKIPADWEVGQIGARHLVFEDEAVPVMEIKWGVVKGTFSHRTHLKRLAALQSRRGKISVAEWILPPHWEKSLTNFKTGGFLWQSPEASGRGAILFCAVCRTATLIQFFGDSSVEREKILLTVLKSFRDHSQDGWLLWSIFDIRATLPQSMQLERFRFEAGKFELGFRSGRHNIHLHRWAPAVALLGGRDLVSFSRTIPEFSAGHPTLTTIDNCEAAEWSLSPGSGWRRKICRFKLKPSFYWFRMWCLEKQNRILGVRAEGKDSLDIHLLNQICEKYESF